MVRTLIRLAVLVVLACQPLSLASAQMAAARLGVEEYSPDVDSLPLLDRKTAESLHFAGRAAEVRVRPTQVRIVLAVTSEGKTAQECQRAIQEDVTGLRNRWQTLRISPENIVEDFIAILPVHTWNVEKRGDAEVGVEQRVGFRMQTNVHVSAPNDETATRGAHGGLRAGNCGHHRRGLLESGTRRGEGPGTGTGFAGRPQQGRHAAEDTVRYAPCRNQCAGTDDRAVPRIALRRVREQLPGRGDSRGEERLAVHPRLPAAQYVLPRSAE